MLYAHKDAIYAGFLDVNFVFGTGSPYNLDVSGYGERLCLRKFRLDAVLLTLKSDTYITNMYIYIHICVYMEVS